MLSVSAFCLVWVCLAPQQGVVPPVPDLAAADASSGELPAAQEPTRSSVPVLPLLPTTQAPGVDWTGVSRSSLRFLAVMHAFRWATEHDTRQGGFGWGQGYVRSISNLHGWADGDPYYINYFGHPAQGAISGRLLLNHDPRYRGLEFGNNPDYWKGKLRSAAFAWAFSEQFELGLLSEASIGHIQERFPQQGLVDHVVTPTIGTGLMVGEDAIDRYVIRRLEDRLRNKWARLALRTGLNPTRSFANLIDGKAPWHRDTRAGVLTYVSDRGPRVTRTRSGESRPGPAPLEISVVSSFRKFGGGPCLGGGAEAAYRLARSWQVVAAVNGCNLMGLAKDLSGDALVYQTGARWTPAPAARWSPYVQVLLGGIKVTHEQLYPDRKAAVEAAHPNPSGDPEIAHQLHDLYTSSQEVDGLAVSAGTGVDYKINDAFAVRLASLEFSKSMAGTLAGKSYAGGFQFATGMVLRLGTW